MAKAKAKKSSTKTKKSLTKSLPKSVRKSGLMELVNSDLGRKILADALIAAAGAAAAALTQTRPARKTGAAVAGAGSDAADMSKEVALDAADAVAGMVTEAARHFLPASLIGEEHGNDESGKPAGRKKVKYAAKSSDHTKRKTTTAKSAKSTKTGK